MNTEFFKAFDELEREKHIPKEFLKNELERALVKAYEEEFHTQGDIKVDINEAKKNIKVYKVRKVVADYAVPYDPLKQIKFSEARLTKKRIRVGDDFLEEIKTKEFSFMAISKAKGMITQSIKEYTKKQSHIDMERKREEIVTGEVVGINDDGSIVVKIGETRKFVSAENLIPNQTYELGQLLKFYVSSTPKDGKTSDIVLSRTHKKLLSRLFELESPELQSGDAIIKNVVREPGQRAKMFVDQRKGVNVDPIGACIGKDHARVTAVSKELNGENIDILLYSEVPEQAIKSALSPALILKVEKGPDDKYIAHVVENQYSVAIGKEGQNVRLAAKLSGYKIEIVQDK